MNQTDDQTLSLACLAQLTLLNTEFNTDPGDFVSDDFLFTLGVRPSGVVDLWVTYNDQFNAAPACHVGYVYPNGQTCEKVNNEGWPENYCDVVKLVDYNITYNRDFAQLLAA
jgi:hypothetical protein